MPLEMKQAGILTEQRVVLKNISWDLFERLLAALGDNRSSRLAYDRGLLEIMTPLLLHEYYKRLISLFYHSKQRVFKIELDTAVLK